MAILTAWTPDLGSADDPRRAPNVHLELRTGGEISGQVLDHTDHGLVVINNRTPYVFSWRELEGGSAYVVRRALLIGERGDVFKLSAEDHFKLGLFALANGRHDLAHNAFRAAAKLEPSYERRGKNAFAEHRARLQRRAEERDEKTRPGRTASAAADNDREASDVPNPDPAAPTQAKPEADGDTTSATAAWPLLSAGSRADELRGRLRDVYLTFGEQVREVLGRDITLVESEHFLIWTDWWFRERQQLVEWFEAMYDALCEQFDLDPATSVFPAKCPAFCFQWPARFRQFARKFDGYDGRNAVGYTRSIEAKGHTHVVLVRQGDSEIDLDAFATTLVHEGTHAFLHRLYSPRLIPHWVNEGLADLMAERVLGDRSPTAENAALLAQQFVRYDWPIGELLESSDPIAVHQYPLAHSVVAHLESRGRHRFAGFVRSLKDGRDIPTALAENYDGLTLEQLEADWRKANRPTNEAGRSGTRRGEVEQPDSAISRTESP